MTSRETPEFLIVVQARLKLRSGRLFWRASGHGVTKGAEAGCLDAKGYRVVRVCGARLKSHRVIYALHYGHWPDGDLDHKNGVRSDNRVRNLRIASNAQNMWNRRVHVNSKTGVLGVCKKGTKWLAQLRFNRVAVLRNSFDTLDEAVEARRAAERKYFGAYAPTRSD